MDLSTERTSLDSVFDHGILGFKNPGGLFRSVCFIREPKDTFRPGVLADGGPSLEAEKIASGKSKVQLSETGSVRHISKADDVSCRACAPSLFDALASRHSRMDETAFLKENRTEHRGSCAGKPLLVAVPNVAAKRERNSMKPLMRQTLKKRGHNGIDPESKILVGTSNLAAQTDCAVSKNRGGL